MCQISREKFPTDPQVYPLSRESMDLRLLEFLPSLKRCHVVQNRSIIGSLDIFSRILSHIHRTRLREEAITSDKLRSLLKKIKHV